LPWLKNFLKNYPTVSLIRKVSISKVEEERDYFMLISLFFVNKTKKEK